MKTLLGPSIHLAQFSGDTPPFDTLSSIAEWAAALGFRALQIPAWDERLIDLARAAESQTYCDEIAGTLSKHGLVISELSAHVLGQLVAAHPAYDAMLDAFAPSQLRGRPAERAAWAATQLQLVARASRRLGLTEVGSFSGALAWPYLYPWPPRPAGLIETAFAELARRWQPILDVYDQQGVNLCFEIHPGEDLHDGVTFEMFLERVHNHPRHGESLRRFRRYRHQPAGVEPHPGHRLIIAHIDCHRRAISY